ncbi:MAG: MFS transporter [Acidobacteria bacterium]|nr:MFS transporter [Acidobacteriota bacterium]
MRPSSPLVALQHRNFRLLWSGQLVSFAGSMAQTAAILWHVSLLVPPEKKGLALGMVGFVRVIPIFGLGVFSGVVADAHDRRRVMLITQTAMGLVAVGLAIVAFAGVTALWPIYLFAALGSAFGIFDGPARQALIPALVPREHLPNAISLNTIMFQIASVVGPSIAGIVIAASGVAWVYVLNAASFVFVIVAILMMRDVPEREEHEKSEVSFRSALDGLKFVFGAPMIRSTMLVDFFATFFSCASTLLPIFAQDILHVGPHGYGWLYAAPSIGAVLAGVAMVRLVDRIDRRGMVLIQAVIVYGIATVLFGLSRSFALTFLCLAATGAADTVSMVLRNVIRQLGTPDALRGRMTGVNMVFFMGGPQLGEMEAGVVANAFGARASVVSGGIGCLVATVWLAAITPALRHYRREVSQMAAPISFTSPDRSPGPDASTGPAST